MKFDFKFNVITVLITLLCTYFVIYNIEKHSVHPVFGNYKKMSSAFDRCSPWEACE
jgi:hypothetical protein